MKHQYFNGLKFTRDDKTGYYLNSMNRKRIHRYVWEYYNGEIPEGYEIHHIDHDKSNNDISNLQLLTQKEHMKLHGSELTEAQRQKMRDNLTNTARPEASKWHGSKEGIAWHKKHYDQMKDKLYIKSDFVCTQCGKEYISIANGHSKFCSNACKSKYRRNMGFDNVERICANCGNKFNVNKYAKTKYCSRSCANIGRSRRGRNHEIQKNKAD